jgi:hypothetical protein
MGVGMKVVYIGPTQTGPIEAEAGVPARSTDIFDVWECVVIVDGLLPKRSSHLRATGERRIVLRHPTLNTRLAKFHRPANLSDRKSLVSYHPYHLQHEAGVKLAPDNVAGLPAWKTTTSGRGGPHSEPGRRQTAGACPQ